MDVEAIEGCKMANNLEYTSPLYHKELHVQYFLTLLCYRLFMKGKVVPVLELSTAP
jgi:hypothetical protein